MKKILTLLALFIGLSLNAQLIGLLQYQSDNTDTDDGIYPWIYNFKIVDGEESKVYFDSSEPLTATNYTGFSIPYRSITGLHISTGATTGHYFTVSSPHNYYNITTIEYDGTGDIEDLFGNNVYPFTMEYIDNQLSEPSAPNNKYASPNGSGAHDGSSEANAWSYAEMDNSATAGDHVWVKAGTAVGTLFFTQSGTAGSPIIYEGYKTTPGDITSNYLKGGDEADWLDSEMPTIVGTSRLSDTGWQIQGLDYVIFRNFQIRDCRWAIQHRTDLNSNIVYENINTKSLGNSPTQSDVSGYFFDGYSTDAAGNKIHFQNCVSFNASQTFILTIGDNWLIEGCEFTSTNYGNNSGMDYGIALQGDRNVVKDVSIILDTGGNATAFGGFGVSIKARWPDGARTSRYNLVVDCYAEGLAQPYGVRWENAEYNVVKRSVSDGASQNASGGLAFQDGASFNIFEDMTVINANQDWYGFIMYFDNAAEEGTGQTIEGNVIRNSLFVGGGASEESTTPAINFGLGRNQTNTTWYLVDNRIENCTFYDIPDMYNLNTGVSITNFEFTNNIVNVVDNRNSTNTPTIDETYNDHYDFWGTNGVAESGTGNMSVDPILNGSYVPTATFTSIDVPTIAPIYYDLNGDERNASMTTVGAIKSVNE